MEIIKIKSGVMQHEDFVKHANLLEQGKWPEASEINLAKRCRQPDLTQQLHRSSM